MTAHTDARAKVFEAASLIGEAVSILRDAGCVDTADELARERKMVAFHIGLLERLENAPDIRGIEQASTGRMIRQAEGAEPWDQT